MAAKDRSAYFSARYKTKTTSGLVTYFSKVHKLTRLRTGSSNPNWRRQVYVDHTNATTNMSGEFVSLDASPGNGRNTFKPAWEQTYSGDLAADRYTDPGKPTILMTTAHEKAVQQAYKQIRKTQVRMSGQVFLGELKEAMHMLRSPAEGLRRALKDRYLDVLQKRRRRDPLGWKKAIPQTWLEGCFGWRPFLNDLQDAASAYEDVRKGLESKRYEQIRAVGRARTSVSEASEDYTPVGNMWVRAHKVVTDDAVCVIRGQVKALTETTTMNKLKLFGLTPDEFIPTVWELLPWSFLVDYFTNIGDILEAGATDVSSLAWVAEAQIGIRTMKVDVSPNIALTKSGQGANFLTYTGSPSHAVWKHRSVQRGTGVDLSIPPLSFSLPTGPIQQLNMVALAAQAHYGLHPQKYFGRW